MFVQRENELVRAGDVCCALCSAQHPVSNRWFAQQGLSGFKGKKQ